MTWTPPQAAPASYQWLERADPNAVTYELFLVICNEWVEWQRSMGVQDRLRDPAIWVQPGDLQTFVNVVIWWPKTGVPTHLHCPTLAGMVTALREVPGGKSPTHSFIAQLEWRVNAVKGHVRDKGGDADNPNETSAERAARKNRERQERWRIKHAPGSDDPVENALIEVAKAEASKLTEWKTYLRTYVKDQRLACDAAVRNAKQARDDNISAAEKAIADQEIRMLAAKDAVNNYSAM